jgi:hypothetical protein
MLKSSFKKSAHNLLNSEKFDPFDMPHLDIPDGGFGFLAASYKDSNRGSFKGGIDKVD